MRDAGCVHELFVDAHTTHASITPPTPPPPPTAKAAEAQILGCQLLKEAHKRDPGALFAALSVPDALSIGHEVLAAQRSLLRELAADIFPRFQAHPFYEALCEEVGPEWRCVCSCVCGCGCG